MAKKFNQPRLDADVAAMVAKVAKRNSRTVPREVNHVLREHYTQKWTTGIGQSADGSAVRFHTVLDPTPRKTSDVLFLPVRGPDPDYSVKVAKKMPSTHAVNRMKMRG